MALPRRMLKSVFGRQLGISSTGGIISAVKASGLPSTQFDLTAQMWGQGMVTTTTSTGGATLTNSGVSIINSSATAATFLIAAPEIGVQKELYVISTMSSALTFGGTSTSQMFMKIGGGSAGSTTMTLIDANLAGQAIIMRGLSATQWGILNGSTVVQA